MGIEPGERGVGLSGGALPDGGAPGSSQAAGSCGATSDPTPSSWLANPRSTREVLDAFGLFAKHRLGQNFLVSDGVITKILRLAELGPDDVVFEVGPGIGTLTVALLRQAGAVVSVEADRALEPVLAQTCERDSERFSLVMGDALRVDAEGLSSVVAALGLAGIDPEPRLLVSNLPYQVAATVILRTLEHMPRVRREVVMVQAEVADRIAATPGGRDYGAYTAKLGLYAQVTGRFEVGPGNFMPPPHVQSAVVRIDRRPCLGPDGTPLSPEHVAACAAVIDAAFTQRRKTIRNSMGASGFDRERLDAAFSATGIAPTTRAERLATADFVRLAEALGW